MEGHQADPTLAEALAEVREMCTFFRILGLVSADANRRTELRRNGPLMSLINFGLEEGRPLPKKFYLGDVVEMRKPHPCGSSEWEVMRVGMDFRIRCLGCRHVVMLPRQTV